MEGGKKKTAEIWECFFFFFFLRSSVLPVNLGWTWVYPGIKEEGNPVTCQRTLAGHTAACKAAVRNTHGAVHTPSPDGSNGSKTGAVVIKPCHQTERTRSCATVKSNPESNTQTDQASSPSVEKRQWRIHILTRRNKLMAAAESPNRALRHLFTARKKQTDRLNCGGITAESVNQISGAL